MSKTIEKDGLLETMREDLTIPEDHISTHCSDLLVLFTKERYDWLKIIMSFFVTVKLNSVTLKARLGTVKGLLIFLLQT